MKNRDFKNFTTGEIYHIYNRGVNKEKIFRDEQDYRAFLFRLGLALGIKKEYLNQDELARSPKSRIRISEFPSDSFRLFAFCLMPNHFHVLIEQISNIPVSSLIQKICTSFSMYINLKYKRVGHLFQGNFKSVRIETGPQLMWTSSYIHMNPVKDRITTTPSQYKWSSYTSYSDNKDISLVYKDALLAIFENKSNFIRQTLVFRPKDDPKFD